MVCKRRFFIEELPGINKGVEIDPLIYSKKVFIPALKNHGGFYCSRYSIIPFGSNGLFVAACPYYG